MFSFDNLIAHDLTLNAQTVQKTNTILVVPVYTHPNFQRPHFQFDTVWLIDHVKL